MFTWGKQSRYSQTWAGTRNKRSKIPESLKGSSVSENVNTMFSGQSFSKERVSVTSSKCHFYISHLKKSGPSFESVLIRPSFFCQRCPESLKSHLIHHITTFYYFNDKHSSHLQAFVACYEIAGRSKSLELGVTNVGIRKLGGIRFSVHLTFAFAQPDTHGHFSLHE